MNIDIIKNLSKSELFNGLNLEEIRHFIASNYYKTVIYNKNDIVALSGDKCSNLMIVLEGSLVAHMVADSGKFIQIERLGVGRILAPAMLFADDNVFPVNVVPQQKTSLFVMNKKSFWEAIQLNKKLLFNFIQIISNINRFLSNKIHFLSLRSLRGKIAEYLLLELDKPETNGNSIVFNQTRQELADRFGVSRQSLVRSLSELEDDGMIAIKGKEITVTDKYKLELEE